MLTATEEKLVQLRNRQRASAVEDFGSKSISSCSEFSLDESEGNSERAIGGTT